ncbi:MAG: hypothetical protein RMX96_33610 [Nostoc sp. ChiSLP02]|nr:hypothetical protein [Nostoc sp. DedSLP01]MDZ8189763.1 hypothetical protein [Nostoc sp. ChiSLP02]
MPASIPPPPANNIMPVGALIDRTVLPEGGFLVSAFLMKATISN